MKIAIVPLAAQQLRCKTDDDDATSEAHYYMTNLPKVIVLKQLYSFFFIIPRIPYFSLSAIPRCDNPFDNLLFSRCGFFSCPTTSSASGTVDDFAAPVGPPIMPVFSALSSLS